MSQKLAAYKTDPGPIVAFYDDIDSPVPEGVTAIEITNDQWQICLANPGWTIADGELVAPTPPTAEQLASAALIHLAYAALNAGLAVSSTGTPALNGTYAVDSLSQADVIAIETSLNAGKGFPGGASTFSYPDANGALHSFNEANFTDFAQTVRDYVYGCRAVIAGQSSVLPPTSVTIA
ncbi:hypothetical protein [Paraburkholderia sp. ZP32-5]|uniref:hypothetical protein n=1 Tax=Paraburkholderia sp. ZP32-5 TaxID=2883245 RepID=UPI001F28EDC8|nr:hypothetical protein [Paraburkholderia sp. ZP32-5]